MSVYVWRTTGELDPNVVLGPAEFGFSTDTGDFKLGDGATPWNALTSWLPNTTKGESKLVSIADQGMAVPLSSYSTSTAGTGERSYVICLAATGVAPMWTHWYNTSLVDTDPAGPITFNASLRIISSSVPGANLNTLYRLTFNGRTSATLDPGGKIVADTLGITLAPGDVIAVRTFLSSGTAYAPIFTYGNSATGVLGGFTAVTDLTAPGSAAIPQSQGFYYFPSAILGRALGGSSAKSVLALGDSIIVGGVDSALYTIPSLQYGGFLLRALSGQAGLLNIGLSGDRSDFFTLTNGSFRRLGLGSYCNSAIIAYGTNDVQGGLSAPAVETNNLNIATWVRRQGISKVFVCTITPRTTSTDGFATTINQTVGPGETARVIYNTWVRAGCPIDSTTKVPVAVGTSNALLAGQFGHPFTGFFDTASKVESSLNSGKWLPALRVVNDAAMTSGSNQITSATANFSASNQESGGDKGSNVSVMGAGASGAALIGVTTVISSSTQASLSGVTASTTVSGAQLAIGLSTNEGVHPAGRGHYLMAQAINTALL